MSSRKIWSIPIAALALVLMLAGALVATSIVQAQTISSSETFYFAVGGSETGTVTVSGLEVAADPATDNVLSAALTDDATGGASANFTATVGTRVDVDSATTGAVAGTQPITIGMDSTTSPDAGVYNLTLTAQVDLDISTDGLDADTTVDNDEDMELTTSLTIHVVGQMGDRVNFHASSETAVEGGRLSTFGRDLTDDPQYIQITGLGPNSEIEVDSNATGADVDEGILYSNNGWQFVVDPDDDSKIIARASGTNMVDIGDVDFNIIVDPDATDTNDTLLTVAVDANADDVSVLSWAGGDAAPPFTFYILSDTRSNTAIGAFDVEGAANAATSGLPDGEFVDGIILDSSGQDQSIFSVRGANSGSSTDARLEIVYTGNGSLALGTHTFQLSVNGDSGIAQRTLSNGGDDGELNNLTIVVNPVNEGPTGEDTHTAPVAETVMEAGILEEGDEVADLSGLVTDNDPLTYTLVGTGASQFAIDEDTGVLSVGTGGIADNVEVTLGTGTYARPAGDEGKLLDDNDMYSDIEYEFTVNVSDGRPAKSHDIAVKVVVDVNDPVALKADAVLNADGEYEFVVSDATDGVFVANLLDLNTIFEDDQPDDIVTYSLAAPTADGDIPESLDINGDNLVLTNVEAPETGDPIPFVVRVNADDNYNNQGVPDATVILRFTVTVVMSVTGYVGLEVVENASAGDDVGTVDGVLPGDPVGESPDITYELDTYSSGADVDFSLDENTGDIKVVNGRNYENESPSAIPLMIVDVKKDNVDIGQVSVTISVMDVNEAPMFAVAMSDASIGENRDDEALVATIVATDEDTENSATISNVVSYSIAENEDADGTNDVPFAVSSNSDGNAVLVKDGALDVTIQDEYTVTIVATDGLAVSDPSHVVTVTVDDENDPPYFLSPLNEASVTIPENKMYDAGPAGDIFTITAGDDDGNDLEFKLDIGSINAYFELGPETRDRATNVYTISLKVKDGGLPLDFEDPGEVYGANGYEVQLSVDDGKGGEVYLTLYVKLENVNDNDPVLTGPASVNVNENDPRGTELGTYSATDADGGDITFSLHNSGNAKSFQIDSETGVLSTLESIDYDRGLPCGGSSCALTVIATDGERDSASLNVTVTVGDEEDSVSTLSVTKANPVPGTSMGDPDSALAGTKRTMAGQTAVTERPNDLPATMGSAPMNFVDTDWANWGTVLRIEITAESPDVNCGNGNQCVILTVNSDSADDTLHLRAYRSASQEDKFVAAVELVEYDANSTDDDSNNGVYKHDGDGVPRLSVDEEDEVEIEFGNLRDTIEVENGAPEVSNFAPEHERAFDDADVDYTFTITDDHSGLPEPEDLPDNNGDSDYTPVVALISKSSGGMGQCSVSDTGKAPTGSGLSLAADIHEDDQLYCPGTAQVGEYEAADGGFGFAPIRDDKDFNEIDNGYDVETTIVLTENDTYYVTFIVCDKAGNCAYYDPDGNEDDEELAEITVDIDPPDFVEARTGLNWDSTDNEYDDDRNYIQVIFNDLTALNPATVETDDFVVEGHTVVSVTVYENPDDEDVDWANSGRYAQGGNINDRHKNEYRDLENAVFLELADDLLADETPDVTIVPNGVEDWAGKEQDDGDVEADDWISPKFTIVSITSTRETAQDEVLAGDGDEVTVVVTSDERLDQTRPTVTVNYVNAPSGSVDTKGMASCRDDGNPEEEADWTGKRDRGEIVNSNDCQDSGMAKGDEINNTVEKVSNTEWIVTVTEPDKTGYYSFRVSGKDRSSQENPGSEGIAPADIVTDFFDSDGDVNTDDAVFWEGDKNLAKPNVRVSGIMITDDEPDIEYRSPLFVEIDFTQNHSGDCRDDDDSDYTSANCMNENSEYAEDNFDDVVITMFELDGVDMTDSVKTTDDQTFLVSLENVSVGDHTFKVQAMDQAGNELDDVLEIDFEVSDREPFERRLNPGWNLVSLPGEPADSSIASVFGSGVEVRTVYTYDPVVPGGWMVAVRETLDSDWQGDLMEINGQRGYWVLSDAIQDWEVSIPRLAGGAAGTGTPIQPPSIPLYAGWNLIPVTDITGDEDRTVINAKAYLESLNDGIEAARVLGFNTIMNEWSTINTEGDATDNLMIGSGYWVFVREATTLVPGQ